jgi:hypothetical protein
MATTALPTALDVQRLFIELKDYDLELGEVVQVCLGETSIMAQAYGAAKYEDAIVCRFDGPIKSEDDALVVFHDGAIAMSCDVLIRFIANPYVRDWPLMTLTVYLFDFCPEGMPRPREPGIIEMVNDFI